MRSSKLMHVITPGLYGAMIVIVLTLTGIYATFEGQEVIEDTLTINTLLLVMMLFGTGFVAAARGRIDGFGWSLIGGITGSMLSAVSLMALILINVSINMRPIFANIGTLDDSTLTFGREIVLGGARAAEQFVNVTVPSFAPVIAVPNTDTNGILLLLFFGLASGIIAALAVYVSSVLQTTSEDQSGPLAQFANKVSGTLISSIGIGVGLVAVMGLVVDQIDEIITLPDALALSGLFVVTYILGRFMRGSAFWMRAVSGAIIGLILGGVLVAVVNGDGLQSERTLRISALPTTPDAVTLERQPAVFLVAQEAGILRGTGTMPRILSLPEDGYTAGFMLMMVVVGGLGAVAASSSVLMNNGAFYFGAFLLSLGLLNAQGGMTLVAAVPIFAMMLALMIFAPLAGIEAARIFEKASQRDRQFTRLAFAIVATIILLILPQFVNLYIANVMNWIALYMIMGIGLNVMIGYTGLLDLGYVASFAIGAYTLGILTTPNLLTCDGIHPDNIPFNELAEACTGTMTFWQAWPFCVVIAAFTGMLLGVPVLGLRGDYLAIVTLGFGEITNRIINSGTAEPLLGGVQGIQFIPTPVLNLTTVNEDWLYNLNDSTSIYYLYLFSVAVTAFVVWRLVESRLGRAWRAIRADEDVAEAMGIHLIRYKLMAFGISSAFAGLGGAVFAVQVQGIFPSTFTILISINVLSLIIMGGMGSIRGVLLGAIIVAGLPELLRDLQAYRLLGFGVLLVVVMLTRPSGLLPPQPARLSDSAQPSEGGYSGPIRAT